MSELTLMVLRIGFLLLLWLFIFSIVYALRSDLFGGPVRKLHREDRENSGVSNTVSDHNSPVALTPGVPGTTTNAGIARVLMVTSGAATGTTLPLTDNEITIGRSPDSTFSIVDEYTSTYHAKLNRRGDGWLLTDLNSTNGTKLNGNKITGTVPVPVGAQITVGVTSFELRA